MVKTVCWDRVYDVPFGFPVIIKPNCGDSSIGITQKSVAWTAEELSNAILTILNNPQQARQMGKVSLEIGRAHDEQLTFQAYNDFYCNLAGNHH